MVKKIGHGLPFKAFNIVIKTFTDFFTKFSLRIYAYNSKYIFRNLLNINSVDFLNSVIKYKLVKEEMSLHKGRFGPHFPAREVQ